MSEVVQCRWQLVIDVTVTLATIDASLQSRVVEYYNNPELLQDPEILAQIERNARLRDAVCADLQLLESEMRRRIAWRLEPLHPIDALAQDLALAPSEADADAALVARIASRLPEGDAALLVEARDAGLLSDHTDIYTDAYHVDFGRFTLIPAVPEGHEPSTTCSPDPDAPA